MPRLLLLLPKTTYRTRDFLAAARKVDVEIVVASDKESSLQKLRPENLLTLPFRDPEDAAVRAVEFARRHPIDAVVAVDEATASVAGTIADALSLTHHSAPSTAAARDKHRMREALRRGGVRVPDFGLHSLDQDPEAIATGVGYPCILKPLHLSASRGVIRANNSAEFVRAFRRIESILRDPEDGEPSRSILVEEFVPGEEVALEGLVMDGSLQVLALFDKPDSLTGPYFEETIYVTPSRLPEEAQAAIRDCASRGTKALGLAQGPIHGEMRINPGGVWLIEIAARSIGGLCSRTLKFGTGMSLEELIIRSALGMEIPSYQREPDPVGVMMIPIPRAGVFVEVRGQERARACPGIEEITITAHAGQALAPPPEGSHYLGFIFARAETPQAAEEALREAHKQLDIVLA